MDYSVYNIATGTITKKVNCPKSIIETGLREGESYIEGSYDPGHYKVANGIVIDKLITEKEDYILNFRVGRLPEITGEMTDDELDSVIDEWVLSRVSVADWRKENYTFLRKKFYPPIVDYVDAQVKKKFKNKYTDDGDNEEAAYLAKCEAVKLKFPKAVSE